MKHGQRKFTSSNRSPFSAPQSKTGRNNSSRLSHIDPAVVYEDLLPDLSHGSNGFAWACCPFHDDNNPSLCVNVESGWFKCMSSNCEATGSNIVGFVGRLLGCTYAEASNYLEQHYG